MLRAYHVAGRPGAPAPLGSFEDWSGWVRGALLWLGQADPVETTEAARELDPRLDALTAVITQWHPVVGTASVSVREIIERAACTRREGGHGMAGQARLEFVYPDFREALLAVAGDGGAINTKRLGKWLGANKDRLVQGLRIRQVGLSAGSMRWRVEACGVTARAAA